MTNPNPICGDMSAQSGWRPCDRSPNHPGPHVRPLIRPMPVPIELEKLEHGRIYELYSRNLIFGAWNEQRRSFTGIRQKFKHRFLDEEYYYGPAGSARPLYATKHTTSNPVPHELVDDQYHQNDELFKQLEAIEAEPPDETT